MSDSRLDSSLSARLPRPRRRPGGRRAGAAPLLPLPLAGAACFLRGAFLLTTIESSESDGSTSDWVLAAGPRPLGVLEDELAFEEEGRTEALGVAMDTLSGGSGSCSCETSL